MVGMEKLVTISIKYCLHKGINMNIALLVIDMQKAFFYGDSKKSMEKASEYIEYAVNLFREYNRKVIWIQDEDKEDGNVNGTEG